jgi:hypothetical protein
MRLDARKGPLLIGAAQGARRRPITETTPPLSSNNRICFIGLREPSPALFLCPLGAGVRVTSLGGGRRASQRPLELLATVPALADSSPQAEGGDVGSDQTNED